MIRGRSGFHRRTPSLSLPASVRTRSPAHARQLPHRAKLLPALTATVVRLHIATSNGLPSAALMPPASSREGARDPLGWSPSYHDGPHRPHTSSCPGLGTHHTHKPGHPEPRDDTGHQKEKQQSCRPAPPSCSRTWQCAQRPLGHAGRPWSTLNPWPLKEVTGKLSRRDAWPLHRLHH